ncbi:MAG: NAD(P)-binding domain-containing protein [Flavobacteriales bacterium]
MKKYLIIGCGWLGKPLALRLLSKGDEVWATTSSRLKMDELTSMGVRAVFMDFMHEMSQFDALIQTDFDSIIITVPPGSREVLQCLDLHKRIVEIAGRLQSDHWVYCSSTSVYDKEEGMLIEKDANPSTLIGKLESLYRNSSPNVAILRFGGLIGKDRNPVVYLAKKDKFEKPMAFVNFTTIYEAIDSIEIALEQKLSETYNVVNTDHPYRYEYYSLEAEKRGLTLPIADTTDVSQGKLISSEFFERTTGYTFRPLASQDLG